MIAVLATSLGWAPARAWAGGECPQRNGAMAAVDWGMNASGQIGAGFRSDYENAPQPVLGLEDLVQIKAGFKFGLALLANCTVRAWGSDSKGQLGDGNEQPQSAPVPVPALADVKELAVANAHAMALLYDGTVWTWGASEFGERGNGEKGWERTARASEPQAVPRDVPTQVPGLSAVKQIAAGGTRDYALLDNGEVMAWGEDANGELGVRESSEERCYGEGNALKPAECSTVPRPVLDSAGEPLSGVEQIAAGVEAAYAVSEAGEQVLAWGANYEGELGDGSNDPSSSPVGVLIEATSPVVEVAGGSRHALARLADGEVYAWGSDQAGELGFEAGAQAGETCGQKRCATLPTAVAALDQVVDVAAGEGISYAVKEEAGGRKVIYAFGTSGHYELLGLGEVEITGTSAPTPVAGLGSVHSISASSTTADATLESSPTPAPLLSLSADAQSLEVTWRVHADSYRLRDRPLGTREFSDVRQGDCAGRCTATLGGLRPEPYEVLLKTPEGREGTLKTRKVIGTPLPAEGAPADLSAPVIAGAPPTDTGKLRQGQVLTASAGEWSNGPTEYSYSWLRCQGLGEDGAEEELGSDCEPIESGAGKQPVSGATYEAQADDVGDSVIVRVRASNARGWSVAVSAAQLILGPGEETEPPPPIDLAPPSISGSTELRVRHGTWEDEPTSLEDKWLRCKGRIAGGSGGQCSAITVMNAHTKRLEAVVGESYVPSAQDAGKWLEVQERAQNAGGWNVATSQAVTP